MSLPTIVLIHGYPFDHTLWKYVMGPLREKTNVFAPDLPGFGSTPILAGEPSIDLLAEEIAGLLKNEKSHRAVVVGMSMGGYVALSFAERYRDRLAGLVLMSTQAGADTDEVRKGRREMIAKVKQEGPQAAATAAIPKLFAPANVNNEVFKQFPIEGAKKAGVEGISYALEAMARRPDRNAILRDLGVPVLVLHGAEDKFIPVERARQMAQQIPAAEYVEVPNAGHALPLEAPDAIVKAIINLLGSIHSK